MLRGVVRDATLVLCDPVLDACVRLRPLDLLGARVRGHHARESRHQTGRDLTVPGAGVPGERGARADDGQPVEERDRVARPVGRVRGGVGREVIGECPRRSLIHGAFASAATNARRSPAGLSANRVIPFTPIGARSASTSHRSPTRTMIRVPTAVINWPPAVHT